MAFADKIMSIENQGVLDSDKESRIATNLRTLLILEAVANAPEPLSPTEINKGIGLPKQSIHRLCQTMVEEGFLMRDTSGKRLLAAPRSISISKGLLASRHLNVARHQVLMNLSSKTRETVNFVVPEPDGMTYLDRVETDWLFRIELPIGSRVPFHCTASGKVFLASMDDRTLDRMLSTMVLEQRTANTFTDKAALKSQILDIRKNGYALDSEELFEGMVALAVPINDEHGRFQAAVAFHGPTQRLSREKLIEHLDTMRDGAAQLASITNE